jgi:hypothetical protein
MEIDLSKVDLDWTKPWKELLVEYDACAAGLEYSKDFAGSRTDASEAWDRAPSPEFLLWALQQICANKTAMAREFMCWCLRHTPTGDGRTVWDLIEDERSQRVVEVAERHVRGEVTDRELTKARQAARAALTQIEQNGKSPGMYAARAAARAGARAKIWAAAVLAAWDAAQAAAKATIENLPDDLAKDAFLSAWQTALQAQADAIRAKVGNPVRHLPLKG